MRMRGNHLILKIFSTMMIIGITVLAISSVSFALIVFVSDYPTSSTSLNPVVFLNEGPSYSNQKTLGLVSTSETGSPPNIVNGTIIYINNTAPILATLETNNTLSTNVNLWINGTLPSGVTICNSSSSVTLGNYIPGTRIILKPGSPDQYFGFGVTTISPITFTLFFDYQFSPGISVTYSYPIYVNE